MLNRMPDENTNPVWTTQTSQNNQTTTNQSWNDFTLDFWWEDKNKPESEWVELNLDATDKEWDLWNSEQDIDLGFIDDAQDWEISENNVNIQDLDSLLNEKQNDKSDIPSDDTKENKQNNLEGQENSEWENDIISNDENNVESNQNIEDEKNKEDFDISLGDTKQENIEEDQNNERKENDSTENYNSSRFEVENTNEVEKINNEEVSDFNNNLEENTEKDISSESTESSEANDNQEAEEKVSEKNVWEIEERSAQWDDFSISFDDNADLIENSDNNLDENDTGEGINDEVDKDNLNIETENDEKSELLGEENPDINPEKITGEEITDKEAEQQEINLGEVETEDVKNNLSTNQEESSENKIEENFTDESNFPELWTEDKDGNTPTEIANNDEPNDESLEEPLINNNNISDNKEETVETKTNDENLENHDSKSEDFIMNFNLEEDTDSQQTKQPEMWDLMWNLSDEPVDENNEKNNGDENNGSLEETPVTNNIDDTNEIISNQQVSQNNIVENNPVNDDTEKQDFTLDYVDDKNNKQEEMQNNHTENSVDNVDNAIGLQNEPENPQSSETSEREKTPTYNLDDIIMWNNSSQGHTTESNTIDNGKQELNQSQVDQVNNISESIASESIEKNQNNEIKYPGIATLSLDQILDSELNSNPQYADNSKAVPKNVPLNSWFFNKKTIWIMAVALVLAGFVAVLAFPSKKAERKDGDIVQYTWSQLDEQEHYAWDEPIEDTGEYIEIKAGVEESTDSISDIEPTTDVKRNNPKIDEFPDPSSWEEDKEDPVFWEDVGGTPPEKEPEPYTCMGDECAVDVEEPNDELIITIEEIESMISKFKSEAEKYYTLWDDNQDKKLIKYALQIINLCDNYQWELENGEQNIQETFEEFNSKIIWIKSKIEKYIGWGEEVETFTQSNFKDEYDYEWKDDLINFIKSEDL